MRIERIAISRLNPAAYNPRADLGPGDPEYQKLRRSLDEFGLVEPLVWNRRTGHVVGGHQRLKLLAARGDTHAPVSVVDLPLKKEKALNVALNKICGSWDERKLAELLSELVTAPGFDVGLTGFDPPEVEALLAEFLPGGTGGGGGGGGELEPEAFDAHAAMAEADAGAGATVTRPGEVIELGDQRLWCGDCTDAGGVRRLMAGERAVLFATDPPYLVNYDGTNHFTSRRPVGGGAATGRVCPGRIGSGRTGSGRVGSGRVGSGRTGSGRTGSERVGTERTGAKDWSGSYGVTWDDADANSDLYERFIRVAVAEAVDAGAPWYCWHASKRQAMLESVWNRFGAFVHQQIVWVKPRGVLTRSFYTWRHEPCLMGWIKGRQPKRLKGEPMRSSVWTEAELGCAAADGSMGAAPGGPARDERPEHPTPKPLFVFETPLRQHTRRGDVVYEPFCGSGTQLIAAQRLGRRCRAVEISPRYCDVIVRRWIACVGPANAPASLVKRYLRRASAACSAQVEAKPAALVGLGRERRAAAARARKGAGR